MDWFLRYFLLDRCNRHCHRRCRYYFLNRRHRYLWFLVRLRGKHLDHRLPRHCRYLDPMGWCPVLLPRCRLSHHYHRQCPSCLQSRRHRCHGSHQHRLGRHLDRLLVRHYQNLGLMDRCLDRVRRHRLSRRHRYQG